MGRIQAPFGVKGWVKVQPFTQHADGLLKYSEWLVGTGSDWQAVKVAAGSVHGSAIIAQLAGIDDRDAAFALRGREVAVPRSAFPATKDGEYYWVDLIGMEVRNLEGERLGKVARILETGANPVVVLDGDPERLFPFVDAVVRQVDFDRHELLVDWGSDF